MQAPVYTGIAFLFPKYKQQLTQGITQCIDERFSLIAKKRDETISNPAIRQHANSTLN